MNSPWNGFAPTEYAANGYESELWSPFAESFDTGSRTAPAFENLSGVDGFAEFDGFGGYERQPDFFGQESPFAVSTESTTLPLAHESPEQTTIRQAISAGNGDVNKLTNLVFNSRHPERNGTPLTATEPHFAALGAEWTSIRDTVVRPIIAARSGTAPTTALWVPGAERIANSKSAGGSYIGAPWRFVFHTIEGEPSANGFRTLAAGHANPPHLWAMPSADIVLQTIPLDRSAYALARPGSVQTNRANAIQVELWGFAAKMGDASAETLNWLADRVLAPVARLVPINLTRVTDVGPGEPCYGKNSSCRMSAKEWESFDGVTGHHRVPDNDHWDPGKLRLAAIAERARISIGTPSYPQREQLADHDGPGFEAESDEQPPGVMELWSNEPGSNEQWSNEQRPCSCAHTEAEAPYPAGSSTESEFLRSAIANGQRDVNQLANLLFFRRHPERNQRLISTSEPNYQQLSQEWLAIRDTLVLPALGAATPSRPPSTTPPAGGGSSGGGGSGGGGAAPWGGYENGRIPAGALCSIASAPQWMLECAAAKAFDRMNTAYRAQTGMNITINDAYRSFERQVEMKAKYGNMAATPGTSNHGWGKAVDLGNTNLGVGPFFDWLNANAGKYGWVHPPWARPGGSKPESHHWEFGNIS